MTSRDALEACAKFRLKMVEKNNLINNSKKELRHLRYAKAFIHDKFTFYKWGKVKVFII